MTMPELSLEFNSLLGSPGIVPHGVPGGFVAGDRGFRDHLDELRTRPQDESVTDRSMPPVSNSVETAEHEFGDAEHAVATAADNDDGQRDRDDDNDESDGAAINTGTEALANPNSQHAQKDKTDSDAQAVETRPAQSADEKRLTAKPKPQHTKEQLPRQAESADGEQGPSFATAADQAEQESHALSESVEQVAKGKNVAVGESEVGLEDELDEVHGLGRQAEGGELTNPPDNGTTTSPGQPEFSTNDSAASSSSRRSRTTHAKQESDIRTPGVGNAALETGAQNASAPNLATDALAQTHEEVDRDAIQQEDSTPPRESRNETAIRNDRAAAAPTLLSSRQGDLRPASSNGSDISELERVRLVQRVARAFHSIGDEGGEMQLRLRPPELGSMRLDIAVRDGVMTAHLETETAAARNVLLDNLPQLRDRLAEQNVKVERFDVNVRDDAQQRNDQSYENQPDLPRQSQRALRERTTIAVNSTIARGGRSEHPDGNGKLNVVI